MKDKQRPGVYKAERLAFNFEIGEKEIRDHAWCSDFVEKITSSPYWIEKKGPRKIDIEFGGAQGVRQTRWMKNSNALKLARRDRFEGALLHELAHVLNQSLNNDYISHSQSFCKLYLELTKISCSKTDYENLRHQFIRNKVRFGEGLIGRDDSLGQ